MHAPPKADYPVITPDKLTDFDGYIFVIPTRYGRAVSQFSSFFDATGGLWAKQVSVTQQEKRYLIDSPYLL